MTIIDEIDIHGIIEYKENGGSSSNYDSIELIWDESSDNSWLDGEGGVNE